MTAGGEGTMLTLPKPGRSGPRHMRFFAMNDLIHAQNPPVVSMSSLEISSLVESEHKHVKRSMERLSERGLITLSPLGTVSNPGPGPKTIEVYFVGKRDSYVVVAQLSPEFTARLVDRWQELEAATQEPAAPLPNFLETARMLVASLEREERLKAELEEARPAVQFHEEVAADEALEFTVREVCKTLFNGSVTERAVRDSWRSLEWTNQDGTPSAKALKQGLMRSRLDKTPIGPRKVAVLTGKGFSAYRHICRDGDLFAKRPRDGLAMPPQAGAGR